MIPAAGKSSANPFRRKFTAKRNNFLAGDSYPHCQNLLLDKRIKFLNDKQLLHRCGKLPDLLLRQRIDHAELEGGCFRQSFADILIGDAGADDADIGRAKFTAVDLPAVAVCRQID